MKRGWITIMCIFIALSITGIIWSVQMQGKKQERIAPLPEKTEAEKMYDQLRIAVEGQNMRLVTVEQLDEGWNIGISYDTKSTELVTILLRASSLFHGIARTKVPVGNIFFLVRTDELKDVYGHTLSEAHIVELHVHGETFYKIKWDGFEPNNLLRVADDFWIHPEIERIAIERKQSDDEEEDEEPSLDEDAEDSENFV